MIDLDAGTLVMVARCHNKRSTDPRSGDTYEALEVVALKQVLRVEGATGEVVDVDAGVRVDTVGVATEAERLWVGGELGEKIAKHARPGRVWCSGRPPVPVLQSISVQAFGIRP